MSYNARTVTLKLTRLDVCDILSATTALYSEFDLEAKNPETSADRKAIAASSAKHWEALHDKVRAMLDAFDEKNNI